MKAETTFRGSSRGVVLEAVSAEDRQLTVVALDRNAHVMFSLQGQQQLLDAWPQVHDARSLTNVVIGGFKDIHASGKWIWWRFSILEAWRL